MEESNQISLIASIMKSKNRNGTKKRSKSTMTCPTISAEMKEKFKIDFLKIFSDNRGEWLRWVDVSQTVVMKDPEMMKISKSHNRTADLGPSMWTFVMKELVGNGLLETEKVESQRLLRMV